MMEECAFGNASRSAEIINRGGVETLATDDG
jgi:hypothetical protein